MQQVILQADAPWWHGYVGPVVPYVVGCVGAFAIVQSVKKAALEAGRDKPGSTYLRLLAFMSALALTSAVSYILFDLDAKVALTHGVICGVCWPVIVTVVMVICKQRWPKIYDRLRVKFPKKSDTVDFMDRTGTNYF